MFLENCYGWSLCKQNETQNHLFPHCCFAIVFWSHVLVFCSLTLPMNKDFLKHSISFVISLVLQRRLKMLWLNIIQSFFLNIWLDRNNRPFNGNGRNYTNLTEYIITAASWYKLSKMFCSYSLKNIVAFCTPLLFGGPLLPFFFSFFLFFLIFLIFIYLIKLIKFHLSSARESACLIF